MKQPTPPPDPKPAPAREEHLAFLGALAAGLAHEIRNPLSTLSVNLQLLREDWEQPVTEKEQRSYRKIQTLLRETKRLEQIVSDFLRFAAGHDLRRETVGLPSLLDEQLEFIGPAAARAGIRIHREVDPALPAVQADAGLLRQALLNLLLNAQQAMPRGGDLTVRARRESENVFVEISDTGVGIPEEIRERIFNVYFSTKPGGTGLGLPTAKRIVEEHGGSITVESAPGRGTTFRVRLPLRIEIRARPAAPVEPPGQPDLQDTR